MKKRKKENYSEEELKKISFEKKEIEYADKLLLIAKEDLDSSKILFKSKKYMNSIREFQQSVEKVTKVFTIITDSVTSRDLKEKINHYPLSKWYLPSVIETINKTEHLQENLIKYPQLNQIKMIKKLNLIKFKKNNEIAKQFLLENKRNTVFSDDILNLNAVIKDAEKTIKEAKRINEIKFDKVQINQIKKQFVNNMSSLIKVSREIGKNPINEKDEKEILNNADEIIKNSIRILLKFILLGAIMNRLNLLLNLTINNHFDLSRYPDIKNPIEYYTKNNPLIKKFENILEIQKENISLHKKYIIKKNKLIFSVDKSQKK